MKTEAALGIEGINSASASEEELKELSASREGLTAQKARLLISAICAAITLCLSRNFEGLPRFFEPAGNSALYVGIQFLLALIAMSGGIGICARGFKNLFRLRPDADSLAALATSAAFLYSAAEGARAVCAEPQAIKNLYFDTAAAIIVLFALAKHLVARSVSKAREEAKKLLDILPKRASIMRPDGLEEKAAVWEIKANDILVARPGDVIAADGLIVKETSLVDEAALTGESTSTAKKSGDKVFAGTVNMSGMIAYRIERTCKDTVLSKIISIVEEAQADEAPIVRLAGKISAALVPVVLAAAAAAFFSWLALGYGIAFALETMVCVLVTGCITSPGLAVPAAIISGIGKGAQLGVLFKSGQSLEELSRVKVMVFGKAGTITEGRPHVVSINPAQGFSEIELLKYAAAAEKGSAHPIAKAIAAEAESRFIELPKVCGFLPYEGRGVEAAVGGKKVKVGSLSFFKEEEEIYFKAREAAKGSDTAVIVAIDGRFAGRIALRDEVKPGAPRAISAIKRMGVKTVLVTGGSESAAQNAASKCGIGELIADVLPGEKLETVEKLKERGKVAVAECAKKLSLAEADVVIAVGAGTDIEAVPADITLKGRSLLGLADALALSKKVMRSIRENLLLAFIFTATGIPLAAGLFYPFYGLRLTPMAAALAVSVFSVLVVLNALRPNLFKSRFSKGQNKRGKNGKY